MTEQTIQKLASGKRIALAAWINAQVSRASWAPYRLPSRLSEASDDFYRWMLIPGLHPAFQAQALGRSLSFVREQRGRLRSGVENFEILQQQAYEEAAAFGPADGLVMARVRSRCQLPYWSRLALVDYRKEGVPIELLCSAFMCSPRAIHYVASRTDFANLLIPLPNNRLHPPGMFKNLP